DAAPPPFCRSACLWLPICRNVPDGVPAAPAGTPGRRPRTTLGVQGEAVMGLLRSASGRPRPGPVFLARALATLLAALAGDPAHARKPDPKVLRIGTSGTLTSTTENAKEKGALESLRDFIKTETGLDNQIIRQKDWRELAEKVSRKELDIGVFQGY